MTQKINYDEMFKTLLWRKPYRVDVRYKALAIQGVRNHFGFAPDVEISEDGEYAILTI